jgi:uncharacterized protein
MALRCPVCRDEDLQVIDKQGVKVDYCRGCRGVWLDGGELEEIIRRENSYNDNRSSDRRDDRGYERRDEDVRRSNDDHDRHDEYGKQGKKKESFLGDLFDF